MCEEYKMEATIQNKMRLDKWDAYTTKEVLGYKWRKSYMSAARETEEETSLQTIYWSLPIRKTDELMKNWNKEKDIDTQRKKEQAEKK